MPSLSAQGLHQIIPMLAGLGSVIQLFVLVALLLMSIVGWGIILRKAVLLRRVQRQNTAFVDMLQAGHELSLLAAVARRLPVSPLAAIFETVYQQLEVQSGRYRMMLDQVGSEALALLHDRLRHAAQQTQGEEFRRLEQGLSFLATTAGVAPFIGLLGTVWGIMQSFHAIGQRGGATLAVVGPGISEALVVTAAGLAVAIPAVVAYNHYLNRLRRMEAELDSFSEEIVLRFESYVIQMVQRPGHRPAVPRS
jgi:biopolymer transport protein TolQ